LYIGWRRWSDVRSSSSGCIRDRLGASFTGWPGFGSFPLLFVLELFPLQFFDAPLLGFCRVRDTPLLGLDGTLLGFFFLAPPLEEDGLSPLVDFVDRQATTSRPGSTRSPSCPSLRSAASTGGRTILARHIDCAGLLALDHNDVLAAVTEILLYVTGLFSTLRAHRLAGALTSITGFLGFAHTCSVLDLVRGGRPAAADIFVR
jgi:hypothetical protein